MGNKRVVPLLLSGLIAFGANIYIREEGKCEDIKTNQSSYDNNMESELQYRLGWENLNKEVIARNIYLFIFCIDYEYRGVLCSYEQTGHNKYKLFEVESEEYIAEVDSLSATTNLIDISENFFNGEIISDFGLRNIFGIEEVNKISELLPEMLKITSDLDYWYGKNNQTPKANLSHKNTVPSDRDTVLIKLEDLRIADDYHKQKKGVLGEFVMFVTYDSKTDVSTEIFKEEIKIGSPTNPKTTDNRHYEILEPKNIKISKTFAVFPFETQLHIYGRNLFHQLRAETIIIDGERYVSVGTLRKIYENIDYKYQLDFYKPLKDRISNVITNKELNFVSNLNNAILSQLNEQHLSIENQVDYSYFDFKKSPNVIHPSSNIIVNKESNFIADLSNMTLSQLDKPKIKELTKKS